jgi:hypothetical protein
MAYTDPRVACSPWITSDRLCCEGGNSTTDCDGVVTPLVYEWSDAELIQSASNMLFARTCFRYPGICSREVWPCIDCCSCSGPCCCGAYYAIELTSDYPILDVTSVTINGVVENPANYRLDENARIVRTDGEQWPTSNNLGLTNYATGVDEIRVVYDTGRTPPMELQMACAELVCELKKACSGDPSCSLPSHVKSVTRRGVDYEVNDVVNLLAHGLTGNPIIDHALTLYGNCPKSVMFDAAHYHRNVRIS